jgi:fatty aldehyde-generating acyl-ACP reductase
VPAVSPSPAFAFIVHPRDEADIFRAPCLSLLRTFSTDDSDFLRRALALPPTLLGEVTFGFSPFRGDIISIACLPPDVMTERGRREIARAVVVAADRGASVVGLGALTAPATAGGARLVDRLPLGVTITNGNAYTAAVLVENVIEASASFDRGRRARVAVVGCTGSVGTAVSRLLAERGFDLVLVGRTAAKARRKLGDLAGVARFSGDPADAGAAEIVLLLTSVPSATLVSRSVYETVVVIDAAEPPSLSDEEVRAWAGQIRYARGGRVLIPGSRSSYDFALREPEETYACLAETYLFVREGIRDHSVGSPSAAAADRLGRAARRHGVFPAPLIYRGGAASGRRMNHVGRRQHEVVPPR